MWWPIILLINWKNLEAATQVANLTKYKALSRVATPSFWCFALLATCGCAGSPVLPSRRFTGSPGPPCPPTAPPSTILPSHPPTHLTFPSLQFPNTATLVYTKHIRGLVCLVSHGDLCRYGNFVKNMITHCKGQGKPTRILVGPWRQGFRQPTKNKCMGWFAQIHSKLE